MMEKVKEFLKTFHCSKVQASQIKDNLYLLKSINAYKFQFKILIMFCLFNVKLTDYQLKILKEKYDIFEEEIMYCKDDSIKLYKYNEITLNVLLVFTYRLLALSILNKNINLESLRHFIEENFEKLNNYRVYNALVQQYLLNVEVI